MLDPEKPVLCRRYEGSISIGWSRERCARGCAFEVGAARERYDVGLAGAPRGAGRTAAVSRSRVHVVVRVLHGSARALQVVGGAADRRGARVQEVPGRVRPRGEWRIATLSTVVARPALERR